MKPLEHEQKMDELLSRAIGREGLEADFEAWKKEYEDQIRRIESEMDRSKATCSAQLQIWRIVMKSRTAKLTAAAVLIILVLIVVSMFSASDQPPRNEPVVKDDKLSEELVNIKQMLAAGDIDGLVAKLAEADFNTQVAAADYLAKMDDVEALEVLAKLNAGYAREDAANPFAPAVEKIRGRMQVAKDQSSLASVASPAREQTRWVAGTEESEQMQADTVRLQSASVERPSDGECRPELTEGASGKGYYFDGDGDYILIGPIEGLGAEQTKMLWVNVDPSPPPHCVYLIDQDQAKRIGNNNWIELVDTDSNGAPNIRAGFDSGNFFDSEGDIEVGYWYHIAVVSTSAGDVYTYINGVFDSSRSGFSTSNEPNGILIGGTSSDLRGNFKGIIDEVAVFNRALSDEQIWRIYQNTGRLRGFEQGLIGYWNFDYDQGDVVKDSSRYGNDAKLSQGLIEIRAKAPEEAIEIPVDAPEAPADGESKPELTEGASGKGYYFDGSGDYIEIGPIEGLGAEHTKMLWVNPDTSPPQNYVYLIDQDQIKQVGNNNWIELVDPGGNGPNIRAGFDSSNFFDSKGEIRVGDWYHVAVVSTSAGDVYTYINGVFDSSRSGFSTSNQPEGILIGATSSNKGSNTENFKGIIDEVAFFNRALSDEEIWRIYQNTGRLRGFEAGLVGYWNFDYDDDDIVRDSSREGNDGRLGGADTTTAPGQPSTAEEVTWSS